MLSLASLLLLAAPAVAAEAPEPPATGEASPLAPGEIELEADRITHDEQTGVVRAEGHVKVVYDGMVLKSDALRYDPRARTGAAEGHVTVVGEAFELAAARGSFDLQAESATLEAFSGRWAGRAQVAGDRLMLGRRLVVLENGWITPCMHPEADLRLRARQLRYFPDSESLNLVADGVAVQVWGQDVLALPTYTATIGEEESLWREGLLPYFGFDAYHGFLTSSRLDFSLGANSRGSIPVTFSTGRGWSASIQHLLNLGPGELANTVTLETPWAANRGGLRAYNAYRYNTRQWGRFELAADYRSDMNGQPVSRLPEGVWFAPALEWRGVVRAYPELRAGYLLEETSETRSLRARLALPWQTPVWSVFPFWQTWLSGSPFAHAYEQGTYVGASANWNHRQTFWPGISLTETAEVVRVAGETPFFHDRTYDVERLRLNLDKDWGPRVTTTLMGSWSRLNQTGSFAIEDVLVAGTYRWNCFGLTLGFRPLILGTEVRFQMLNF